MILKEETKTKMNKIMMLKIRKINKNFNKNNLK